MKQWIEVVNFELLSTKIQNLKTDGIIFLIDEFVWDLYKDQLNLKSLVGAIKKKVILKRLPRGEKAKCFSVYERVCEEILEEGIHRNFHVIACGGGAISDISGFIASSLLRGLSWSVIPTTLLSMVDASIGGKTGINSKFGKNLIGAFHMPEHVWLNPLFLETLPKVESLNGYGEVLKYSFLDKKIKESLLSSKFKIGEIILKCANYKNKLVEEDFREKGPRKYLNLGHTFGHAFEKMYPVSHGEAVYWGMKLLFYIFERKDLLKECDNMVKELSLSFGKPPWLVHLDEKSSLVNNLMNFVKRDKKVISEKEIELVFINEDWSPYLIALDFETIRIKLDNFFKESHVGE
ncbi:MAG: hypothetical protein CME68_08640 [Halobacteriovoraceae bacterium]|nr:hypothetical protein [Halobacteriovoraceae bacterium]